VLRSYLDSIYVSKTKEVIINLLALKYIRIFFNISIILKLNLKILSLSRSIDGRCDLENNKKKLAD